MNGHKTPRRSCAGAAFTAMLFAWDVVICDACWGRWAGIGFACVATLLYLVYQAYELGMEGRDDG